MRLPLFILTLMMGWQPAWAAELPFKRLVVADPRLARLLADGYQRSDTLRHLMQQVEDSGWIVFVIAGPCPIKGVTGCLLHTVGVFDGQSYLRLLVQMQERHPDTVLVTVAHELQHALEVATSDGAHD